MTYRYDIRRDCLTGHDWPGLHGSGFERYVLDEIEVGARAAMGLDDPEQWWWELHRDESTGG